MSMTYQNKKVDRDYLLLIGLVSIVIPALVAYLIFSPSQVSDEGKGWIHYLPHLNGMINTITAIVLLFGLAFIKKQLIDYHKYAMLIAFGLGFLFLISYVIYHASVPSTVFGDLDGDGILNELEKEQISGDRKFYLALLLSHIVLAILVVPLVLLAIYYALSGRFYKHRRIVKFAWPIWFYVSVTGVLVYWMIKPYY